MIQIKKIKFSYHSRLFIQKELLDINYPLYIYITLYILFINDLHNYFLLIMPTKQIMKIYQIG